MDNKSISPPRLFSLDFFRGLTMFLLIAESTNLYSCLIAPGSQGGIINTIGAQLHHHPWNGLRFWDLVQPFFMFIVGVAMPFSFSKRLKRGDTYKQISNHIFKRCFLLLVLGWALSCISHGEVVFFFQNVLAQLSVTILISFLLMRKPATTQFIVSIGLLTLTEILYRIFWVEGYDQPFIADHNFGSWVDMLISGRLSGGHWVSFNAIPTTAHTIWGVLVGQLLMRNIPDKKKLLFLVIAGLIGITIGYGLNSVTPIIKRIATSSFVFASGGWALLSLAISYGLIDLLKLRKGVLFFAIVGMNPLFIYLFAHVGGAQLINHVISPFTNFLFMWAGGLGKNLVTSSLSTFGLWYICYWMYKQKIFIKI